MRKESAGLQSLQQYMRMAQRAPNPNLAMSILDQHFGAQDALQRIKKLAPKPILPVTPATKQFVAQAVRKIAEAVAPADDEDHRLRNYAMGAAAAAPFAGMIGQKPVIHDPHLNPDIQRFATMAELSRQAQPGDVLLTTKPGGSVWKSAIQPLSGSEFYHAQPVVGRRRGHGTTLTAGQYDEPEYRRNLKAVRRDAETIRDMSKTQEYPDVMLMRPKKKLAPEQLAAFKDEALRRSRTPYDHVKAPMTWLKEMFLPKVDLGGKNVRPPVCEGNVCSTLPAMAYERAGVDVLKGKRSQDIFPPDYLRSEAFEPVGVRLKNEYATSPALRKAMPYMTRAGLGAALAAGTYGVSKDPALAAVPVGAAAGAMGANALARSLRGKGLPSLMDFLTQLPELKGKRRAALVRDFAGKSVPATLAGAGLAYGGAKALQHWLAQRRATERAGDETS